MRVGLARLPDSFKQSLTLPSSHQVCSLQFLVKAVELSLVFLIFCREELVCLPSSVRDTVAVTGGHGQLLLVDGDGALAVVPVLGDGEGEVGEVLHQVLHTLVVRRSLLLPELLDQLPHAGLVRLLAGAGRLERLLDLLCKIGRLTGLLAWSCRAEKSF